MSDERCSICGSPCKIEKNHASRVWHVYCQKCGEYAISDIAYETIKNAGTQEISKEQRHIMSCRLWELNYLKRPIEPITIDNFKYLHTDPSIPETLMEKLSRLLVNIYKNNTTLGQVHSIDYESSQIPDYLDYRSVYAHDVEGLCNMLNELDDMGYLKDFGSTEDEIVKIMTTNGFKSAEAFLKGLPDTKQVFVAMWFTDEMTDVLESVIKPAAKECGYNAITVADKEHNHDINDEIIAEIRRSKFVIADFTGQRGGVYFEAGFAQGLGLEVIRTCKDDKEEIKKLHFDIRNYSFILWKDKDDLKKKLIDRIRATII